ncbi:ABC transporter substrate-binding protein [Capillibacterium thermochitinicola]|uniref:ABC transporter substrate-binding protein n=1 Tax=Capillibacterium thermochitinicola TaxID=2699427 RepID=UPI002F2B3B17
MNALKKKGVLLLVVILLVSVGVFFFLRQPATDTLKTDTLKIGIVQIVEHPALDSARQGFIDLLTERGYVEGENITYEIQNAQGDMATANTIAQKFKNANLDLILAIATPTAQAVANLIKDKPILFTAVTDPVAAGLVESAERPGTNVTGTNDLQPMEAQFKLAQELVPQAKRVGIIYNAGETNSVTQVKMAKDITAELGLTVVEATVDTSAGVLQAAQSFIGRVDLIYVPTDNTVVSAFSSVVKVAEENKLPIIAGEANLVSQGALATVGVNYYRLGRQTAEMALRIIEEGAKPQTMPVESQKKTELVINEDVARALGINLSAAMREIATLIRNQ